MDILIKPKTRWTTFLARTLVEIALLFVSTCSTEIIQAAETSVASTRDTTSRLDRGFGVKGRFQSLLLIACRIYHGSVLTPHPCAHTHTHTFASTSPLSQHQKCGNYTMLCLDLCLKQHSMRVFFCATKNVSP